MKRYLIILFSLSIVQLCAQENTVTNTSINIDKHKQKILKKLKCLSCYDKKEKYEVYFIYHLDIETPSKEIFTNELLLKNLKFISNKKKKAIPSNIAMVYNDSLSLIASSEDLRVTCSFNYPPAQALLHFAIDNNVDFMFRISGSDGMIYFAVKENVIQVIEIEKDEIKTWLLEEFVSCCWEKLKLID